MPHEVFSPLNMYVTHLALSEGLEDLGNVGGEAHVDKHHLRELREGKRDEFGKWHKMKALKGDSMFRSSWFSKFVIIHRSGIPGLW